MNYKRKLVKRLKGLLTNFSAFTNFILIFMSKEVNICTLISDVIGKDIKLWGLQNEKRDEVL
ncbi:hypothetical protein A6K24_14685 [Metabacillus litoralis]|uniref:Uncharacterized protein n=1 Tax=Metabacillus litoralis TaxID=152268 RepID=A0A179T5W2_9BACI|nr:hypothetical protein A6K24_14685 [Metabacillus litoralis]